jgi:flavin reductase (DIM6/NTAB) family NADH-FMN oxidoreductase RutF
VQPGRDRDNSRGRKTARTTITAFSSLSLEPPLVAVALDEHSQLLRQVRLSQRVGINLLARGQEKLALSCAGKAPDKFSSAAWSLSGGLPRINEVAGWLACEVQEEILLGDHVLIVARVVAGAVSGSAQAPLVYAGRAFGTHSDWLGRDPHQAAVALRAARPLGGLDQLIRKRDRHDHT